MRENLTGLVKIIGIVVLLFVLWGALAWSVPDSFLKAGNLENLMRRTALFGILGIGVAFVIMTGGIDLSIGSLVCLCACLFAMFLQVDYRPSRNPRLGDSD
jgi:ribose transport system permease protein